MRRVKLIQLQLENFMGIRSFTLHLNGNGATVRGTNGVGKTSLATAFSWLLTGKDARGQANFEVKTLENGEALHNLEHTVEAVLDVDGDLVTLRRAFVEVWTKKRGAAREEFTGHETRFWIDGVPCGTKKEFDEKVSELVPSDAWRELTNPDAWHAQHWQKRRQDLIDMCGDVTDADVIDARPDLAELPTILGRRTPDEHRKVLEARRREVNQELKLLPARIDEVQRQVQDLPAMNAAELEERLKAATAARFDASAELARLEAGGGDATQERRRLREIEDELTRLERDARQAREDAIRAAKGRVTEARAAVEEATRNAERLQARITEVDADAGRLEERLAELRSEWAAVNVRQIEAHTPDTCPACKQALPAEQVQAAHRAAIADLNAKKAKELERITEDGRRLKASRDQLGAELASLADRLSNQRAGIDKLQANLDAAVMALEKLEAAPVRDVTERPEYARLASERDELTARIQSIAAADPTAITDAQARITEVDNEITRLQRDLALVSERIRGEDRKRELLDREQTLAHELEDIERQQALIESFVRAKSALLTDRINARFRMTSFKLFDEQLNGGLADTCTALVDGVPYDAGLNRAARINSGLDVIAVLQQHHGVNVPIFVDEGESVVELLDVDTQVVRLVVDERHPTLTVELDSPEPHETPEEVAAA